MRIVQLLDSLAVGGTERMVVHLGRGLRERGHHVLVVCLRESGPLEQPLKEAGVEIAALGKPEGFHWEALRKFRALIGGYGAQIVHTHNPLVHHYGAWGGRWAGAPVVVSTVHGIGNLNGVGKSEMIFAAACLFTDRVVAVCEKAREVFARHPLVPAGKLAVVYNGIPLASYLSVAPRKPGGDFVFGVVGRMVPVKDHGSLLKAFSVVARQRDNCRMEFLGDGVLRRELEQTAASLGIAGRVHFHGERPADGSFYEGIDVFVLSSLSEGLPMTVLEAMASARPVVSTAVGGVPELVEGARAGWLCPPGNVEALSNALLEALRSDTHREMGQRAREYVRNRGSVEAMVTGYENLFRKLLGEQTHPIAH